MAVSLALGAGSSKAPELLKTLKDRDMLNKPFDEIIKSGIFDDKLKERLLKIKPDRINGIFKDCEKYDIRIISAFDKEYPERLLSIPAPPVVLYVKGNLPDIDVNPVFCIVGPRKISDFGQKAAYSLSRRLGKAGMIIVSGTAAGGDSAAHSGALNAKAISVMVSAEGIVTQLESKNHALCNRVLERGCIISENPPRAGAGKFSFPIRNRIMSGLSIGVAVVEAPKKSGALITASHAAEQGRDVFVIPGSPADKCYEGSNALLRDGATPLLDASDIFTRYIFDFPDKIDIKKAFGGEKEQNKKAQKKSTEGLSKEALLVYNNLVLPEFTVDDLSALELDGAQLLSALTELEMEHFISSAPGGIYKIS